MDLSPLKESSYQLLKKLCETPSPSGHEDWIRDIVIRELEPYADEISVDSMGNVIAVKRGGESKIMVAAHMDEIALMVKHVDKRGFLRVTPIGGWSDIILPGQRVLVITTRGEIIKGVVGSKPPHIMKPEEAKQVIPIRDLFIDIGVSSREEAEKLGVKPGAVVVIDRDVARLGNPDRVTGRAFDDKVGVVVMIEAFKRLENTRHTVYAVATVQEEVGLKGARTSAYAIGPDLGIALDVTIASDLPSVKEDEWITELGKGPAIKVMDGRSGSGIIVNRLIREKMMEIAEEEGIPYQLEVLTGGTTDASAIQLTKAGVPTGAISIPTRYIHSPIETLDLNDVAYSIMLLKKFIEKTDPEWVRKLKGGKIKQG